MNDSLLPFVQVQVEWALHHRWAAGQSMHQTQSTADKLWLVLDGELEVWAPEQQWTLTAGTAMLSRVGHQLKIISTPRGVEWLSLGFDVTLFRNVSVLESLAHPQFWRPEPGDRERLEAWMRQIVALWVHQPNFAPVDASTWEESWRQLKLEMTQRDVASTLMIEGLGRAIFGLCWQMTNFGSMAGVTQRSLPSWLHQAFDLINEDPSLSVAEVGRKVGFSPAQFRRLFQEWAGTTPQNYLSQHRLQEARWLLAMTDLPVNVIAQRLGFDSLSYFTRFFKRETRLTPREYRQVEAQNRKTETV